MLKNEFLNVMQDDLVTNQTPQLVAMFDLFKEVLKDCPNDLDIDSSKTVEDCYSQMKKFAEKNQQNGAYCFTYSASRDFVKKYLGVKDILPGFINLEDFI